MTDVIAQGASSYAGELLAPTIGNFVPQLSPMLTQAVSTGACAVGASFITRQLADGEEFTASDALYSFIISVGAEAITSGVLDSSLALVGRSISGPPAQPAIGH